MHLLQEGGASGFHVKSSFVKERVFSDLLKSGSFVAVELEESENKVLEFSRQASAVNLLEVKVGLASQEEVVEVLVAAGFFEGEDALNDNEKDNSHGE